MHVFYVVAGNVSLFTDTRAGGAKAICVQNVLSFIPGWVRNKRPYTLYHKYLVWTYRGIVATAKQRRRQYHGIDKTAPYKLASGPNTFRAACSSLILI